MTCKKCNADLPDYAAFCPFCGAEVTLKEELNTGCKGDSPEVEAASQICESENTGVVDRGSSCADKKPPYRKIAKIAVVSILGVSFICSAKARILFGGIIPSWMGLIAIVGMVIQLFRRRSIKKFALALGGAVVAFIAALVVDVLVAAPDQFGDRAEDTIVGEWEATVATVYDSPTFFEAGEGLILTAKKDGSVRLRSHDYKIDMELYWSYDENGTNRLREGTDDATVCVYDLLYGDRNNGLSAFYCMAHENDLYIQSSEEYDGGEFSAYFKPGD